MSINVEMIGTGLVVQHYAYETAGKETFEEAATARQAAAGDHCRRETPLFAASIGRHANATK
jgi:hypothetical protein